MPGTAVCCSQDSKKEAPKSKDPPQPAKPAWNKVRRLCCTTRRCQPGQSWSCLCCSRTCRAAACAAAQEHRTSGCACSTSLNHSHTWPPSCCRCVLPAATYACLEQPSSPAAAAPAAAAPVAQEQHWPTLGDSKEAPKKKKGSSTPPEQPPAAAGSSKVSLELLGLENRTIKHAWHVQDRPVLPPVDRGVWTTVFLSFRLPVRALWSCQPVMRWGTRPCTSPFDPWRLACVPRDVVLPTPSSVIAVWPR